MARSKRRGKFSLQTGVSELKFRQWRSDDFRLEKKLGSAELRTSNPSYQKQMTDPSMIRTDHDSFRYSSDYRCRLCYPFSQVSSSPAAGCKLCESEAPFLTWIFRDSSAVISERKRVFRDSHWWWTGQLKRMSLLAFDPDHGFFQSKIMILQNLPFEESLAKNKVLLNHFTSFSRICNCNWPSDKRSSLPTRIV